jgi:RNA polymerase sigma factor (sigma-70 family)
VETRNDRRVRATALDSTIRAVVDHVQQRRGYWVNFALGKTGGSAEDAEDVVQVAVVALIGQCADYDSTKSNFKTWTSAVFPWLVLQAIRDRTNYRRKSLEIVFEEDFEGVPVGGASDAPSTDMIEAVLSRGVGESWDYYAGTDKPIIWLAMTSLNYMDRALLTRAYVLQEDQADIAQDWGIKYAALRFRLMDAKRKLRQAYISIQKETAD